MICTAHTNDIFFNNLLYKYIIMDLDKVWETILDCRFERTRNYDKTEKAISFIQGYISNKPLNFYLGMRGLVVYPDLLDKFLKLNIVVEPDDYASMIARCIEYKHNEVISCDDWHHKSILLLINYPHNDTHIQLLIGKYKINENLYNIAKINKIYDPYYDGTIINPIHLKSHEEVEHLGRYGGYRTAYYFLLYGGERKKELISWWIRDNDSEITCSSDFRLDCTYDAACDLYKTNDLNDILIKIITY